MNLLDFNGVCFCGQFSLSPHLYPSTIHNVSNTTFEHVQSRKCLPFIYFNVFSLVIYLIPEPRLPLEYNVLFSYKLHPLFNYIIFNYLYIYKCPLGSTLQ